jgi:hypothetical protein
MTNATRSDNPAWLSKAMRAVAAGVPYMAFVACAALALPRAAFASWGFTATIYESGCPVYVTPPSLPSITGFPTQSMCDSVRTQVLAITVSSSGCTVGYHCSACAGSDDVVGGLGTSSPSLVGLPVGAGTLGTAGSMVPLNSGVTAVSPYGPDAGQPTFSPHYSESATLWQKEATARYQAFPTLGDRAVPISSVQYGNHFALGLSRRCGDPGCLGQGLGGGFSTIRTLGPTYSQPDTPQRTSDDPSVTGDAPPLITIDPSQAQSIGGAGVTQGKPDTPPPPTPYRTNPGEACHRSWWYNTATHMCYGSSASCQGDNSAGPHQCYQ